MVSSHEQIRLHGFYLSSGLLIKPSIHFTMLDYNAHIQQHPRQHGETHEFQYHRQYRKETKNWDVVKVMEAKQYKYIPELLDEILKYWHESTLTMRSRSSSSSSHLTHIQPTIAHTQPPNTHVIVNTKFT